MTDTRSGTGGKGQPSTANTGTADPNQLANAVASRDLIGQAKGILMERYKISPERAFLV